MLRAESFRRAMTTRRKSPAYLFPLSGWLAFLAFFAFSPRIFPDTLAQPDSKPIFLTNWTLGSSCVIGAGGKEISSPGYPTRAWHAAAVPSTVVAALVADGTYPDPYFGENLRSIPGTEYPIGKMFSVLPMPLDSPFRCSWWYRTAFRLPADDKGRHVWLHFGGINYRANIWLNGRKFADAKNVAGAYRTYEFDVTPYLSDGPWNVLAVETIAPTEKDLGINWVDWNPEPPDKDMGLWREVSVRSTGPVVIRYPQVITHFPSASLGRADLTVEAEVQNAGAVETTGTLSGQIEDTAFQQTVTLAPGETREVRFTPDQFPQLHVENPVLWWPAQMGQPNLHELSLRFSAGGELSDSATIRFGIREITSELDAQGHRLFRVNGKKILIRGGGWAPDMLFRQQPERLKTEFRYIRDMNLNAIRLEGKMETDEFYDLADENGILIMAGWCCCDYWEHWPKWKPRDLEIATASLRSQIMRVRSHPSMMVWLEGSDNPPPANVERAYVGVLKESDWPNPYISSASEKPAALTGPSGVKMMGPYDYVPPDYWLADKGKYGGAYGFNTETAPGPAIPPLCSLKKMLPDAHIHPDDSVWNYHAGSEGFKDLSRFDAAMSAIYGAPAGIEDYERKAQAMAYDGERAMFEAYSGNKYGSTGVIQWMLNNAWPSLIWHLYDYYLQPAGGYFGAKKACEKLHVQYSYDDRGVVVVNSGYQDVSGLTVAAKLYDLGLHERFSREARADLAADAVAKVLELPEQAFQPASPVYFLQLTLEDSAGSVVSTNFYWLSAKKNSYEWEKTTYAYTPVGSYEDLTALSALPNAHSLAVSASVERAPEGPLVRVHLQNPGDHLAFQIHLGIQGKIGDNEILPVLWDDNYVELMPGESREITAQFLAPDALEGGARLVVTGWNIAEAELPLRETKPGTPELHAQERGR